MRPAARPAPTALCRCVALRCVVAPRCAPLPVPSPARRSPSRAQRAGSRRSRVARTPSPLPSNAPPRPALYGSGGASPVPSLGGRRRRRGRHVLAGAARGGGPDAVRGEPGEPRAGGDPLRALPAGGGRAPRGGTGPQGGGLGGARPGALSPGPGRGEAGPRAVALRAAGRPRQPPPQQRSAGRAGPGPAARGWAGALAASCPFATAAAAP